MAKQNINIGSNSNDGTGDPLRTAFDKINSNFTELYNASPATAQVTISGNQISANESNADLVLSGSGTGDVVAGAVRIHGTSITSDDSSQIQINENLDVGGNITASGNITATGNIFANGNINLGNAASDQTKVVGVFEADQVQIDGTTITTNTTNGSLNITGNGTGGVNIDNLIFNDNSITSASNADINLTPGGTGGVVASGLRFAGTSITADDSSTININEGLNVDGTANIEGTLTTVGITTTGTHTITGQLDVDGVRIKDNEITATRSDDDLNINSAGSGAVILNGIKILGTGINKGKITSEDSTAVTFGEAINVQGGMNVSGTTTTADVVTTGNTTVSGSLTTGTFNVGDLNISADGTISTDTNGDINIDPAGTGAIVLTGPVTHAGTQTTTGQLNVDNIRIDGNAITATNTNGGINITPDGTGSITLNGNYVAVTNELAAVDVAVQSELILDSGAKIIQNTTNTDLVLETNGTGTIRLNNPQTQMTVGAVGAATHLPLDSANEIRPVGYLKINLGGTEYVIPYFNAS